MMLLEAWAAAGNIEMAVPAAGEADEPRLCGVEGFAAVNGIRFGGCGSGNLEIGLIPDGVIMLACAAVAAACF